MLSTLLFDFLNVYVFEKASKVDTVSRACSDTLKLQNNFRMLKRLNIIRLIIKKILFILVYQSNVSTQSSIFIVYL